MVSCEGKETLSSCGVANTSSTRPQPRAARCSRERPPISWRKDSLPSRFRPLFRFGFAVSASQPFGPLAELMWNFMVFATSGEAIHRKPVEKIVKKCN